MSEQQPVRPDQDPQTSPAVQPGTDPGTEPGPRPGEADPREPQRVLEPEPPQDAPD